MLRYSVANTHIAPERSSDAVSLGHRRTVSLTSFRMSLPHNLFTHFRQYFEILRADTTDLLEQAFRLRYQVYCQEGLLPGYNPLDYPDGLERDIYDYEHRSAHCLLRHRPTGTNAGTVRLVLHADRVRPDAPFPIEESRLRSTSTRDYFAQGPLCQPTSALFQSSRFILARRFRSRRGEHQWPDGLVEEEFRHQSREQRAPGPTASGSGSHQGGHNHELGAPVELFVHGDGAATSRSTTAPVRIGTPAGGPG